MSVSEDDNSQPGFPGAGLSHAVGSGKWKDPFFVIPRGDSRSAILCEYFEDKAAEVLSDPLFQDDDYLQQGGVYSIPGGERFLILNNESADDLSDPEQSRYMYRYYGTLYNAAGEELDRFSFAAGSSATSDAVFTENGSKMLCGNYIFDLDTHELTNLEDILPDVFSRQRLRSAAVQQELEKNPQLNRAGQLPGGLRGRKQKMVCGI